MNDLFFIPYDKGTCSFASDIAAFVCNLSSKNL